MLQLNYNISRALSKLQHALGFSGPEYALENSKGHIISLYVTSACGLQCEHCIMMDLMMSAKSYQMKLQEVENFIRVSENSGYKFDIILTGGEPLLWKSLKEGVKALRNSSCCNSITMFTNAGYIERLDQEVADCLNSIRISEYDQYTENVGKLKKTYGRKVKIVHRGDFWKKPTSKVPNSLPAICLNPEFMFYDNQIFACPHSASIKEGNGSDATISTALVEGFVDKLPGIREGQEEGICSFCISNKKVQDQLPKVKNINLKEKSV